MLFSTDVFFNFFTVTVDKNGRFETSKKVLFLNYFQGWFFFDFVTSLPYQIANRILQTVTQTNRNNSLFRLLKIPRFYRLLRIFRLYRISDSFSMILVRKTQERLNISNSEKEIIKMILWLMFFNHCMACVWFVQAKIQNFPLNCWVVRLSSIDNPPAKLYIQSFYWALQTLLTVGYGDINAQ